MGAKYPPLGVKKGLLAAKKRERESKSTICFTLERSQEVNDTFGSTTTTTTATTTTTTTFRIYYCYYDNIEDYSDNPKVVIIIIRLERERERGGE